MRIVFDISVLVAALRSRRVGSFALLSAVGQGRFEHIVSVPLVMEYESVLMRAGMVRLPAPAVQAIVDFLCATATRQEVHFLLRPRLPDPNDDMVLEAAANGGCAVIVTHNVHDFAGARTLGVQLLTPTQFLALLEEPAP
jgi:predicted nucleic acid-binding protein